MNLCPKCEKHIVQFTINGLDGNVPFGRTWKCIALCCPHCKTIVSAQIDPIAIKSDTVRAIKRLTPT